MTPLSRTLPLLFAAGCGHAPPDAPAAPNWPVELKLELGPTATRALGLDDEDADTREVWFYDTPSRELQAAGLTLRARKVPGAPDVSTVKIRPMPDGEERPWRGTDGFKCEIDRSGSTEATACSLTSEQESGEIGRAGRGKRRVKKLFSSDQETFAERHHSVPWDELVAFGPIESSVWQVTVPDLDAEVTVERWVFAHGAPIVELSTRTSATSAAATLEALLSFATARGVAARPGDTKATQALERLGSPTSSPWRRGRERP